MNLKADVESTCSEAHANKMDVSTTSATSSQFLLANLVLIITMFKRKMLKEWIVNTKSLARMGLGPTAFALLA